MKKARIRIKGSKSRIESFTLPRANKGIRLVSPKRIYSKEKTAGKWGPILFFLLVAILGYIALGHASPPRSRGARPIALGNGYVGAADDIYSLFYNPGGLAMLNQKQFSIDYDRATAINESAMSGFNGTYLMPYRYREHYTPLAFNFYGEQPAPGAHIIDLVAGTGFDAPAEKWTKGFIKFPVMLGGALTIRHQNGEDRSPRVGKSALSLGLTTGIHIPWDRKNQFGFSIRNLFLGDGDPRGPTINVGGVRHIREYLHGYYELEYARGGTWRFKPGLEWLFARGVVRPRLGWGYHDSGNVDSLATGFGFYLSPLQIDFAYIIPLKTLSDNTSQFRASLNYKFGNPQFTEIYFDRALEEANVLDQSVLGLTVKEAELKESVAELEQKGRMKREELETMKSRIEKLKDQDVLGEKNRTIKSLKDENEKLKQDLANQKSTVQSLRVKKASIRTHVVKSGETLQSIAKKYYDDPNQWKRIYNRNSEKIERGLPVTGATLIIP